MERPKASIPKQVKDRIEANQKALEEGVAQGTPPQAPAPAAPAAASTEPPVTPPVDPTPPVTPAVVETAIKPIEPEPQKPQSAQEETLLKRTSAALSALQTRYNALEKDLAALAQSNQGSDVLKAENDQLKASIATLEKQVADISAAQSKPAEVNDDAKAVADELGIDQSSLDRLTKVILSGLPKATPAAAEPKPAVPGTPATAKPAAPVATARDAGYDGYVSDLDTLVGGEQARMEIVANPRFTEFLNMQDGGTKRVIRSIAEEANTARDAVTMAEIYRSFDEWDKKHAVGDSKKPSHLMPASKGGPGDLNTNKKPIYSQAQVDEHNKKIRSGYYTVIGKTADEAAKLAKEKQHWSDEFSAARAEGRIRG